MPRGPEKANEFKRYRQALAALYIATISAGFLLLAASVVHELFVGDPRIEMTGSGDALSTEPSDSPKHPPRGRSPRGLSPGGISVDLVRCHRDVTALYEDLGRQAVLLMEPADDPKEIMPRWQAFSESWLERWHETAAWCRFSELAGSHMGEVYDHLAQIHGELPTMRLHYQSLLVRFNDSQAAALSRMKQELKRSHAQLMRLDNGAGEEAP